ncbi:methyl-CpG-binding domain-containing protein 9 isoform X2 [Mercurialis annua]|uniref:methyl-CpG-binding domain-containing protein 9 isoform X2 n=1 Tax=Mercurialis annua TaxID=3986 RepID=UPI002160E9EC|nr:methyl-CpG-binding domain-containing protein 9 isoform X2 [Mercurialis annua]
MELTDSTAIATRSALAIDLNEIPTHSSPPVPVPVPESTPSRPDRAQLDPYSVVRSFYQNPGPASGAAACLSEEESTLACGRCGKPEACKEEEAVICDGCERAFHLACAGVRDEVAEQFGDWICVECVNDGVKSKRWRLGANKSNRILDINASPPKDCDVDSDECSYVRKDALGDSSASGSICDAQVTYSNCMHAGNEFQPFDCKKGSGLMMASGVGYADILHHAQTVDRSLEEKDLDFPLGRLRSSNNTAIRLPSRSTNEILLQGLKEYVSERHGILEEGWHVELKHSMIDYELYAAYSSPDGKTFGSMSEVACYLGLSPSCNAVDTDTRSDASPYLQERSHLFKKRKSKRIPLANCFSEDKQASVNGYHKGLLPNGHQNIEGDAEFGKVTEIYARREENAKPLPSDERLSIQFEDFFIISLGEIDRRPSYHDHQLIWPVGFRSCWHDRVTGSLFICDVLDGGDSGPVFKVRRFSCSAMPLPDVSTILSSKNPDQFAGLNSKELNDVIYDDMDHDNNSSIEMILSYAPPPTEYDILTCLRHTSIGNCSNQTSDILQNSSLDSRCEGLPSCSKRMGDEIGEFSVEARSSSSAWRLVSQKLIDVCFELYKQKGMIKLYCKHVDYETGSVTQDTEEKTGIISFASLAKFCSSPRLIGIPLEYHGEADSLSIALSKWLDQDRFGFDADFVQEIIEQLPGVDACSKYEVLVNRSNHSMSLTVGNGVIMAKIKGGADLGESSRRCKIPRLGKHCQTDDHCRPQGRLLCSKLPDVLVGDLYQVWELLCRFHGTLGLKEPLSLRELEEELINPWFDCIKFSENFRKIIGGQVVNLDKVDGMTGPISSSFQESSKSINEDTSQVLMQVDKGGTFDYSEDRLASVTHSKCFGAALTEVHSSLLSVLIGELQSKVAALVDPNFNSGEVKSRRGRKKDIDSWTPLRRTEITARESGRVFRCLQGDGGMFCGSLVGVAGMEADALLLAEATKQIYGSLSMEKDVLTIEDEETAASNSCGKNNVNDGNIPEWVQLLEPVRKLPTNVGTRIRKCVNNALEKCPPEWAKKRLEHSISKGVYKGNASGPTKKAVISVLEDVLRDGLPQKFHEREKRKITIRVSDIIMKQCRIILRRAAAADGAKVFCTLLGRNVNSCDHDDEGLLGSPAMISRPLDFRTIDLRLAVGAYGGSHESFLEDVLELWNNVQTAFKDQSDVIELAEKISQNFETLYKKEVVSLIQKFEEFAKLDHLSAETKKDLDNILASTSEIPKAPWDEGICKVCGVDRDDNSVLLCDTCDAEYHTYCLNPPLAKIPEGNWYCPSCVGVHINQEASVRTRITSQASSKRHQGEITRAFFETLMQFAAAMEEKDYWDFGIDERTFLLKFLCDEFLNSALVRQHLEQCVEVTAELQQKLRSLSVEWKNLKSREEFLALRVKDGLVSAVTDQGKSVGPPPDFSAAPSVDSSQHGNEVNGFVENSSENNYEKNPSRDSQTIDPLCNQVQIKDLDAVMDDSNAPSKDTNKPLKQSQLLLSNHLPQLGQRDETLCRDNFQRSMERDSSILIPPPDHSGSSHQSEMNIHIVDNLPSANMTESQAYHTELSTIKDGVFRVQHLIRSIESQLLKQSMRMEFLGWDSRGRMYWASATPGGRPLIKVDGSFTFAQENYRFETASSGTDTSLNLEGSRACFPSLFNPNFAVGVSSAWVSYETDSEIKELIGWLSDSSQKEIELKETIMQWLKPRFREAQQTTDQNEEECQIDWSIIRKNDENTFSNPLVTKATLFLEKKHGACTELDITDMPKKRRKRSGWKNEEKTYRCDCLELIWPSRLHCRSCHRTFFTDVEFEKHNNGRCSSVTHPHEKSEETNGSSKGSGNVKIEVSRKENISKANKIKSSLSELGSRMIKFQNEGIKCPFDLLDICSKFATKDSNKELVQDIGLIGSNGILSFITSISPYLDDSVLMAISPEKDIIILDDECYTDERRVFTQGSRRESNAGIESLSNNCTRKASTQEIDRVVKTNKPSLGRLRQWEEKSSLDNSSFEMGPGHYCVVSEASLRPLVGKVSYILKKLKIDLLDMEAALHEEALRPAKGHVSRRWAWRTHVKFSESIYQMVQATVMLEEMIKTEYLRNEWWYWSSLTAAAKTSTVASLALRIYSLDACIIYEKTFSLGPSENLKPSSMVKQQPLHDLESAEKCKITRTSNKKRKEPEG